MKIPKASVTALLTGALALAASATPNPLGSGYLLDARPVPPPWLAPDATPAPPPRAPRDARPRGITPARAANDVAIDIARRVLPDGLPAPASPLELPCGVEDMSRCASGPLPRTFAAFTAHATGHAERRVRISWFGDSLVMGDGLTGDLRDTLQQRFGDAGHGFLLMGVPGNRAGERGVRVGRGDEWDFTTVVHSSSVGQTLGLAGVAFDVEDGGSPSISITVDDAAVFRRLGVIATPRRTGTNFAVRDARERWTVEAAGEVDRGGVTWVDVDASDTVTVSGFHPGARWHGVSVESGGAGVIVDNIGLVSAELSDMLKIDRASWASQVSALEPDLVVFQYGANVAWQGVSTSAATRLRERSTEWLARVREDLPGVDCLVIGMLTRGDWVEGEPVMRRSVVDVVQIQRETALAAGCAFWSAFDAAGGAGGIEEWREEGRLGGDLSHPTRSGYSALARELDRALMHAWLGDALQARE